ncbi:hypothetical protein Q8F55_003396 [Vanrija albida]|uniref:Fungal-type protein kinase domain-containing protein n=1 Tax=Vanrija albida TaxID=181172 RepID=A0ABR3Q4W9_9TREE
MGNAAGPSTKRTALPDDETSTRPTPPPEPKKPRRQRPPKPFDRGKQFLTVDLGGTQTVHKPGGKDDEPLTNGIWHAWKLLDKLGVLEAFGDPGALQPDQLSKVLAAMTSAYHAYRGSILVHGGPILPCTTFYIEVRMVWHYQDKRVAAKKKSADDPVGRPVNLGVNDLFDTNVLDGIGELCEGMVATMVLLADLPDDGLKELEVPPHKIHQHTTSNAARGARKLGHNHYLYHLSKTNTSNPDSKQLVAFTYQEYRNLNNLMVKVGTKKVPANGIALPKRIRCQTKNP